MRILLLLSIIVAMAVQAVAATYYVTQDGAGAMDGSSVENAWSVVDFNTVGNWSATVGTSGMISPGDTVELHGTISSQLLPQRGGQLANRITILFGNGAKLSSPAWSGSGAIYIDSKSHITIDGGTNGIIECTDNGTAFTYQSGATAVRVYASSHVHVQNLTIRNLYVRTDDADLNVLNSAISFASLSSGSYTGTRVTNCYIDHAESAIKVGIRLSATDIEIANNTIRYCSDGIIVSTGGTSNTGSNIRIHGNRIYDWANWDDTSGGGTGNLYHHDGIHVFATQSGSSITDVRVYNNDIGPGYGAKATSGIYYSGKIYDGLIYNNLVRGSPGAPANGLITLQLYADSDVGIYNNTIYGPGFGTSVGRAIHHNNQSANGITVVVKNNLIIDVGYPNWIIWRNNPATRVIDRNLYYGYGGSNTWNADGSGIDGVTFEYWQGTLGFDVNGINGVNPSLGADYRLLEDSPARSAGENLSAIFTTDGDGLTRPAEGNWDIGAFQYGGGGGGPPPAPESTPVRSRRRSGAKLVFFP